jgi:hypothetical protein
MTALLAFLAILLATLTGHAPAVPAAAAAPLPHHGTRVGQSTSPHRAPTRTGAPVVIPRDVPAPAPVTHPATVEPTNGPELQGPVMCTDPIDCPNRPLR